AERDVLLRDGVLAENGRRVRPRFLLLRLLRLGRRVGRRREDGQPDDCEQRDHPSHGVEPLGVVVREPVAGHSLMTSPLRRVQSAISFWGGGAGPGRGREPPAIATLAPPVWNE